MSTPGDGALIVGVNATEGVTWVDAIALLLRDISGWFAAEGVVDGGNNALSAYAKQRVV